MSLSSKSGLTTEELTNALLSMLRGTSVARVFVIASDEMREVDFDGPFPIAIIQNTDKKTKPGKHWICYYIKKFKVCFQDEPLNYCFYFDSFGSSPSSYNVQTPPGRLITTNFRTLQSSESALCGHFCLYYAYHCAIGLSYANFLGRNFSENTAQNERLVLNFFRNLAINERKIKCTCNQSCCAKNKMD